MTEVLSKPTAVLSSDTDAVVDFLYLEARLADESRYEEWESLWTDDALYWVPSRDDADPDRDVSFIYDNRRRIGSRIAQLQTGRRHSQTPPSKMRRLIANVEILQTRGEDTDVAANFTLFEHRTVTRTWAGRCLYTVRATTQGLRLVRKTVLLINNEDAIRTIAFLL